MMNEIVEVIKLCHFCKKRKADLDVEGIWFCNRCLISLGSKIMNVHILAKLTMLQRQVEVLTEEIKKLKETKSE